MTEPLDDSPYRSRRISPKVALAALAGVLALVFVFQNTAEGQVNFLFWDISMPAWIWLLVIFVAGAVVGSLFPWLRGRRGTAER